MMRFLLAVLAVLLCINEPSFAQDEVPFDASTVGGDGDVIAFVGTKVFVRDDESYPPEQDASSEQDPSSDEIIMYMDSRYQARYEIETLVAGNYEGQTIDFHVYDHYGMPRFSKAENALIFIHDLPEGRMHSKYNYYHA